MLIQIVSDLHTEIRGLDSTFEVLARARKTPADVLVMAGDICNWKDKSVVQEILEYVSGEFNHTIWVAGNHEYYGSSPHDAHFAMEEVWEGAEGDCGYPGVDIVYMPRPLHIDGQHFLCGTGWYSAAAVEAIPGDPSNGFFWEKGGLFQWSDYRKIRAHGPWAYGRNAEFSAMVADRCDSDAVVISHMLPSRESSPKQFLNSATNAFFVVPEFEEVIVQKQPKLWIHGHTHSPCDYWFGSTRVVCNPLGAHHERRLDDYRPVVVEV